MSLDLALPSAREEAWRWSDLSPLADLAARAPSGRTPAIEWIAADACARLLFVDGRLDESRSRLGPVTLGPVESAQGDHPLARLAGTSGWRLEADAALPGPIEIIHAGTGGADPLAAAISLAPGAQATIVETFIGSGWANRAATVAVGSGATLNLLRRLRAESGFASLTDSIALSHGARLGLVTLATGGADSRLDGHVRLETDAAAQVDGALLARDRQRHDANLVVHHAGVGGTSRQTWRSVADDKATCSVAARVEVARAAQKTDAEQSLKGLLLARSATINAKPELEIFADDVKCAHGATVGELDRAALFYFESRGVEPDEARALLTRAFVADAIDGVADPRLREIFYADAEGWFS